MTNGRWAQLTYSSFDSGLGTGGGWQVKQTTGGLDENETDRIRARVVTNFESSDALPQFPTPEEIAALPRRLAYVPIEGSIGFGYWHAVPSGVDGTGRPGNVFTHVLVDRAPGTPQPPLRPVDLWRSRYWRSPFGQHEVLAATLDEDPVIEPGSAIRRETVVAFLLDPAVWRGAVFAAFLDAMLEARAGGRTVVLASQSADVVALWVASASYLMSPITARETGFSLFERAAGIEAAAARGAAVIGIPYEDLEAARKLAGFVVIDDRESPAIGDLGGEPHRVVAAEIAVTPWSVIAQVALQDPALATRVLVLVDEVSDAFAESLHPAWPLAMAVALLPEELNEAAREAYQVLRDSSPANLGARPELWLAASRLAQAHLGTTTLDAWAQVEATSSSAGSVIHDLAVAVYQDRVVGDADWLLREGGVPAARSAAGEASPSMLARLSAALDDLTARSSRGDDVALTALKLADWAVRSGLDENGVDISIERVLREAVAPSLLDFLAGPWFVGRAGTVSEDVLGKYIRGQVEELLPPGLPGERVHPLVIEWLYPEASVSLLDTDGGLGPLALESVIHRTIAQDDSAREYRAAAYLAAINANAALSARAANLATGVWTPGDVLHILSAHPSALTEEVITRSLIASAWTPDLDALSREVVRIAPGRPVDGSHLAQVAGLRLACAEVMTGVPRAQDAEYIFTAMEALVERYGPDLAIPDTQYSVFVSAYVVALRDARNFNCSRRFAKYMTESAQVLSQSTLTTAAEQFVSAGLVGERDFAMLAEMTVRGPAQSPLPAPGAWGVLARLPHAKAETDQAFVALLADALVPALTAGVEDPINRALAAMDMDLSRLIDPRDASKVWSELERFAKPTWKRFRSLDEAPRRSRTGVRGLFGGPTNKEMP